jgi:hypothetical protein
MNASRRTVLGVAVAVAGAAALTGSIVVPAGGRGRYAGCGGYSGGPVMVALPLPQGEVIALAPRPGYFWIGGFWDWVGGRRQKSATYLRWRSETAASGKAAGA